MKELTKHKYRSNLIASRIAAGKVLDIGARDGSLKDFLNSQTKYYGIDKNPQKKGIKKVDLDRQKIPFPSKYFDYIIISEVLEHLSNQNNCMKEAKRVLKDNGTLIITVPNAYNFYHIIRAIFNKWSNSWEHLCIYEKRSITSLLKKYGFKVTEIRPVFFKIPKGKNNSKLLEKSFPALCEYIFVVAKINKIYK